MDIPVKNNTEQMMHCGGYMIAPGETRIIPEQHVPQHLRPVQAEKKPAPKADSNVLDLLDKGVKDIAAALPGLSDADLQRLRAAEEAGKTRKTVMNAIDELVMKRADAAAKREEFNQVEIKDLVEYRAGVLEDADELALVDEILKARSQELQAYRESLAEQPELQAKMDELMAALELTGEETGDGETEDK